MGKRSMKLDEQKKYTITLTGRDITSILEALARQQLRTKKHTQGKLSNVTEITMNHIYKQLGIRL